MEAAVRWSPRSTADQRRFFLVDVAESSVTLKEVQADRQMATRYRTVSKCSKLSNIGAFACSPVQESIAAVGLLSGNTALVQLREDQQVTEPVATYRIKQQRKCNSVAFSSRNWLAVALDKTRSDVCLNIYDVGSQSQTSQDPVRKLCAAEHVSSVRFFPSQPQELLATTQRTFIRLYDLRDGYFAGSNNLQAITRNVNNIAIDPLDENYFASAGSTDDPAVTVWDRRWLAQSAVHGSSSGAVFQFAPAVDNSRRSTVWSLRYSGCRRGRLAIGASNGELKVIDMVEGRTSPLHNPDYTPQDPYGGSIWKNNRYVSQSRSVEKAWYDDLEGREEDSRIIAFDWVTLDVAEAQQDLLVLRPNREVSMLPMLPAKPLAEITARHDLNIAFEDMSFTEARAHPNTGHSTVSHGNATNKTEDVGQDKPPNAAGHTGVFLNRDSPEISRLLAGLTHQRDRCHRGYLLDCQQNASIVAGNWQLERLWETVGRFQELAADDGMTFNSLDLSYVGVAGLWSESIGSSPNRRLSDSTITVEEAIVGLTDRNQIPAFVGERTDFPEHRQVCLAVCGWNFTTETLETECQELIERGLYYRAIVQAVLHDYKHVALNLLRTLIRSRTVQNIGLGALLAADRLNDEQREMCLWMAADTDDPALKALLTFLASGNWRDVMKTNYLHLGYRVALGLKYLNDTELSGFIQSETARAVRNGDLEGVLLTGLGEQAMDLFQTYIVKTSDLQTAVLATAFTNPLYVDDVRWEMWRETYFDQMQEWRATVHRARFKVQHSRMARTREGRSLLKSPDQQVSLRCNHCQRSLVSSGTRRRAADQPLRPSTHAGDDSAGSSSKRVTTGIATNAGTVCHSCGRNLPRCGICMLWLGTPDTTKAEAEMNTKTPTDKLAALLAFCARCGHGFHAHHAERWFGGHEVCPVPECSCACALES